MNTEETNLELVRYPYFGASGGLIDYFLVIGYDSNELNEIVRCIEEKHKKEKEKLKQDSFDNFEYSEDVSIISSISANNKDNMLDEDYILKYTFPSKPLIRYISSKIDYLLESYSIIFQIGNKNPNNDEFYHCFSYVFYELINYQNESITNTQICKIFVPKCFTIVSRYPFFSFFYQFCEDLKSEFTKKNISIPIEIQLFNIINFLPSPINQSYEYEMFLNRELVYYSTEVRYLNDATIYQNTSNINYESGILNTDFTSSQRPALDSKYLSLEQVSGYPMLDIRTLEIFKLFQVEEIIQLIIFSFLEIDMIFFSNDPEILNVFMFVISTMNYPCEDGSYFENIYSENGDNLQNLSRPNSTMIGINKTYKSDLDVFQVSRSHVIVDIDNRTIFFENDPDRKCNIVKEDVDQLMSYVRNACNKPANPTYLERKIGDFTDKLKVHQKKILASTQGKTQSENRPKFFAPKHYVTVERDFQNDCMEFILDLLFFFYQYYEYKNEIKDEDEKYIVQNESFKKNRELNSKEDVSRRINLFYKTEEFEGAELIFKNYFGYTCKKCNFFTNFIENFNIGKKEMEANPVPLLFAEEFLYLKKIRGETFTCSFLNILDSFYNNNQQARQKIKINFDVFYKYYQEQLKHIFLKKIKDEKKTNIKVVKPNKQSKNFYYNYKSVELDKNLLNVYLYILCNLTRNDLYALFPFYSIRETVKVKRQKFRFNEISDSVETSIISLKMLKSSDLIYISALLVFAFTSRGNSNSQLQTIPFIQHSVTDSFFYRRYLGLFLNIFYRLAIEKKDKDENIEFEYGLFLSCLNILQSKKIFFNEELRMTLEKFRALEDYKNNYLGDKESNKPIEPREVKFKIVKTGECKCKESLFNQEIDKYVKVFIANSEFIGRMTFKCTNGSCQKETAPKIQMNYGNLISPLYSPKKLYTECVRIMNDFKVKLYLTAEHKSIVRILMNLIFYLQQFSSRKELKYYFIEALFKMKTGRSGN